MGILMGLLFYFRTEDTYEKGLFSSLAYQVTQTTNSPGDSLTLLLNSLRSTHDAIHSRHQYFNNVSGFKADILQPVTVDLMTGQGACGSYAMVMARLMEDLGFEARMAQMKVGEVYGGHNIVEVKYAGNWIVLDPLYNLYFKKPNGELASFADVHNDWGYYKQQLPEGYDQSYNYADVRYTNWDKIPVLMPALKNILNFLLGGEKADQISIRIVMMRKFNVFFWCTLIIFIFTALYTLFLITTKNRALKASILKASKDDSDSSEKIKGKITILNVPQTAGTV